MTNFRPFDLMESPLEGTNLIEASAGTGKTYAIAGLFLRLVLEKDLPVGRILVVTFTQAATQELRERIRTKLREAVKAFSSGASEDPFLNAWVRRQGDARGAIARFKEALRAFDEAAIFTIHGFCRRMLHENAFESGSLFDTELVAEQEEVEREVIEDFWRRHFYDASPLFVNYGMKNKVNPDSFATLLARGSKQAYLKITPRFEPVDPSPYENAYIGRFDAVRRAWASAKRDIGQILNDHEGLHKGKYDRAKIPGWMELMDGFLETGGNDPFLFKGFEKFTRGHLAESIKKGHTPPVHPFFDLCEKLRDSQRELEAVYTHRVVELQARLFSDVKGELARRRAEKNVQTFDDLLMKLHGALEGEGGEALSRAVRLKFKAALIDEFQDTDPVQYAIFRKIFGNREAALFFIGDPKQAIYGFRGADIFAYVEASKEVASRYTLRENWRSNPALIAAINALFANRENPFLYREIGFEPSVPAAGKEPESLRVDEGPASPFQVWTMDAGKWAEPGKAITKGLARRLIPRAVASEISRLLVLSKKGRASWGQRPLREGDMAVLVRRNAEAILMQKALSELHIPSVLYSTENLFDSHEAMETERVLAAMVEPGREGLLRAAMTTDMTGVKGEELDALMADDAGWERWLVKFKAYHELWQERGFIKMVRTYLTKEGVLTRLISLPDGERRNTNILHLMEVLHRVSVEKKLDMAGLLKWLTEQRGSESAGQAEHQLRLESDENAVRLVTVHKSKGLEYPVVFCPFAWDGSRVRSRKDPFL
ncbi:MAG: UvrD-helicase domain-containing protein, partial [Desulfobacterales bacterium]|nr:UvrD-helicase domain-containing protein [Desulfobacterales bacterium]